MNNLVKQEFHLEALANSTSPSTLLSLHCLLPKRVIKNAMHKGAVWLESSKNLQRIRRDKKLQKGDKLHFYCNLPLLNSIPPSPTLLLDKQDYSLWNKPYGLLSQGSKWSDHWAIDRWIEQNHQPHRPCFIVHRLDRATSGIILIAHSKKVARQLSTLFRDHLIQKQYTAIVEGQYTSQHPKVITSPLDNKAAKTSIRCEANSSGYTLLNIDIENGRKHQVRRHLSQINLPIVGDRLYGSQQLGLNLQLCATQVDFICPINHTVISYHLNQSKIPLQYSLLQDNLK